MDQSSLDISQNSIQKQSRSLVNVNQKFRRNERTINIREQENIHNKMNNQWQFYPNNSTINTQQQIQQIYNNNNNSRSNSNKQLQFQRKLDRSNSYICQTTTTATAQTVPISNNINSIPSTTLQRSSSNHCTSQIPSQKLCDLLSKRIDYQNKKQTSIKTIQYDDHLDNSHRNNFLKRMNNNHTNTSILPQITSAKNKNKYLEESNLFPHKQVTQYQISSNNQHKQYQENKENVENITKSNKQNENDSQYTLHEIFINDNQDQNEIANCNDQMIHNINLQCKQENDSQSSQCGTINNINDINHTIPTTNTTITTTTTSLIPNQNIHSTTLNLPQNTQFIKINFNSPYSTKEFMIPIPKLEFQHDLSSLDQQSQIQQSSSNQEQQEIDVHFIQSHKKFDTEVKQNKQLKKHKNLIESNIQYNDYDEKLQKNQHYYYTLQLNQPSIILDENEKQFNDQTIINLELNQNDTTLITDLNDITSLTDPNNKPLNFKNNSTNIYQNNSNNNSNNNIQSPDQNNKSLINKKIKSQLNNNDRLLIPQNNNDNNNKINKTCKTQTDRNIRINKNRSDKALLELTYQNISSINVLSNKEVINQNNSLNNNSSKNNILKQIISGNKQQQQQQQQQYSQTQSCKSQSQQEQIFKQQNKTLDRVRSLTTQNQINNNKINNTINTTILERQISLPKISQGLVYQAPALENLMKKRQIVTKNTNQSSKECARRISLQKRLQNLMNYNVEDEFKKRFQGLFQTKYNQKYNYNKFSKNNNESNNKKRVHFEEPIFF